MTDGGGDRDVVRLMNDYAARWPLWVRFGGTRRSDWDVSADLADRLEAWAAVFDEHYHGETGWPVSRIRETQRAEGAELARLLQAELGAGWEVRYEFWEENVSPQP